LECKQPGDEIVYRTIVPGGNFYEWLWELDQERAEQTRAEGCACGGRLHRSDFERKPRGGPQDLGRAYDRRLSFCCAKDGCRRRATPPSVRFFGRRVYLGVVVILASALQAGLAPRHVSRLHKYLGCDLDINRRTLARWLAWWRERLPRSTFWEVAKAHLMPPMDLRSLPASLLERFGLEPEPAAALGALLCFLSPVTTGTLIELDEGGI
jgi:hypothetical protein